MKTHHALGILVTGGIMVGISFWVLSSQSLKQSDQTLQANALSAMDSLTKISPGSLSSQELKTPIIPSRVTEPSTPIPSNTSPARATTLPSLEIKPSLIAPDVIIAEAAKLNEQLVTSAKKNGSTYQGILSVSHFHDFNHNTITPIVTITSGNKTIPVTIPARELPFYEPLNGTRVELTGTLRSGSLQPSQAPTAVNPGTAKSSGARSNVPHKISIVLYKFANTTNNAPFSTEDVRKNFFEPNTSTGLTMSQFLSKSTYGNLTLEGKTSADGTTDVYGWYTVSVSRNSCAYLDYRKAGNEAIQMAMQHGLQLGPDDYVVTATFPDGCPTGGSAGSLPITGNPQDLTTGMQLARVVYMNDGMSWGNTLHELGHLSGVTPLVLGTTYDNVAHSNLMECRDSNGILVPYDTSRDCHSVEYGSPFSVMGGYISGAQKDRLFDAQNRISGGYLTAQNFIAANTSGDYDITKINYPDAQIVRIPTSIESSSIGSTVLVPAHPGTISIEARDFESFEQGTDTSPQSNVLMVTSDRDLFITNQTNNKLIPPGGTMTMPNLGLKIQNKGVSPSNPHKVRVGISYLKTPLVIPQVNIGLSASPHISYISPSGTVGQQNIIFTNNSNSSTSLVTLIPVDFARVYPQQAQPLDSLLSSYKAPNTVSYTLSPHGQKVVSVLNGISIPTSVLNSQQRSIYKIMHFAGFPGQSSLMFYTYLVYGQFTLQELSALGVESTPLSNVLAPTSTSLPTSPLSN